MADAEKKLPITILTGFLGAGKTTLLRRMLSEADGVKLGVLVNDFGEINLDAALVVEETADSISLSNGCVCCSIQTELVDAIRALVESRPDLDGIVLEASGVSRSLPIADTVTSEELEDIVTLDGMFCLIDAAAFPDLDYVATELAIDQITGADMLILNKVDLVSPDELEQMHQTLRGIMPQLRIVHSVEGSVARDILFGPKTSAVRRAPECGHAGHDETCDHCHDHAQNGHSHDGHSGHGHADAFASWSWQSPELLDETRLRGALRKLGKGLLRAKGILRVRRPDGTSAQLEFQQVGKRSRLTPLDSPAPAQSTVIAISLQGQIDAAAFTALLDGAVANAAQEAPAVPVS